MSKGVCLVIGGTGGIGQAIAEHLAQRNYTVIVAARNISKGNEIVERIKSAEGKASFLPCDLSNEFSIRELHAEVFLLHGRVDVAINAAGISMPSGKIADAPVATFQAIMDINVTAVFISMQEQLRIMLGQTPRKGHIINIASIWGSAGLPFNANFCASKHALIGLTKTAALEYASEDISVCAVAPGAIPTGMTEKCHRQGAKLGREWGKVVEDMPKQYPVGRYGSPEDVAKAVAYLIESDWSTGTILTIDGGWSAGSSLLHATGT
ncbi:hypothetical protein CKM354_000014600 [Cercospora kikuchii]|uniref:3-oxoacyl-[acyl-carrier-protein] reductase n=1 Tax=Cercospora kikuchii TaxID=84275 RepID=A0A9P3F7I2_9PEZI|nr:uncharacterized protein CKM354_000014600 [Cercospora kikuchii]GIZ36678.1 hypothetical protein CKM354_000014600 [Cercospora kikuchii]